MGSIVENVHFDTVAREWRCKWGSDEALVECQKVLESYIDAIKATKGVKDVQRVVCGGCKDFKVIISLSADTFGAWEESTFTPESEFLEKLKAIKGVDTVETQTFTLMSMM
mmetsp:Transcript_22515/g.28407  ORF Transcript_22515/g.28407 Transcript_22515/m.28407 type:complete len:111 (-) Transcript_22515:115-447(-)|eukprot:CAMPEP_0203650780 /NCGR_PEP_ID=MMETSP0088-20131115/25608_1 /ASSEMBLY_ACC=CAM_ASM_001087 /TAXON_ID=426623 /ORGANISM="Chaetoceros affinis, Strain CCMP159" /LENGTH=110 /DNA_ID=CAMNT_0050509681 /DNA_START=65 /DNA_END=397 /DNA_ORIENTATION=+